MFTNSVRYSGALLTADDANGPPRNKGGHGVHYIQRCYRFVEINLNPYPDFYKAAFW